MNNVVVTGGDPRGYTAGVDSSGNVLVKASGTVETKKAKLTLTANTGELVGTSVTELCPATTGRQALYVSNVGANLVHLRFGDDATSDDFALAPGAHAAFESVGEDVLTAIAIGTASRVAVIEWKV